MIGRMAVFAMLNVSHSSVNRKRNGRESNPLDLNSSFTNKYAHLKAIKAEEVNFEFEILMSLEHFTNRSHAWTSKTPARNFMQAQKTIKR